MTKKRWLWLLCGLGAVWLVMALVGYIAQARRWKYSDEPSNFRVYGEFTALRKIPRRWRVRQILQAGEWGAWMEYKTIDRGSMIVRCKYRLLRTHLMSGEVETIYEGVARSGSEFFLNPDGHILLDLNDVGVYLWRPDLAEPRKIAEARRFQLGGSRFLSAGLFRYCHERGRWMAREFIPYRDGELQREEAFAIPAPTLAEGEGLLAWAEGKEPERELVIHELATGKRRRAPCPFERAHPSAIINGHIFFGLAAYNPETSEWIRPPIGCTWLTRRRAYILSDGPVYPESFLASYDIRTGERRHLGVRNWGFGGAGKHSPCDKLLRPHGRSMILLDLDRRATASAEEAVWNSADATELLEEASKLLPICLNMPPSFELRQGKLFHQFAGLCGPRAVPFFLKVLRSGRNDLARRWATGKLLQTGRPEAMPYVIEALVIVFAIFDRDFRALKREIG